MDIFEKDLQTKIDREMTVILASEFTRRLQDKQLKRLEDSAFSPLKEHNLYDFALELYEGFISKLAQKPSRITRNACLLHISFFLEDIKKDEYYPPELHMEIRNAINQGAQVPAFMINAYASEYLKQQGVDNVTDLNNLYAAALISPLMEKNAPQKTNKTYIGLVGSEAFKIAYQHNLAIEDDSYFHNNSITPEAKLIHLVERNEQLNFMIRDLKSEVYRLKSISPHFYKDITDFLNVISDLMIAHGKSSLEYAIISKYSEIEAIIGETPICDRDAVIPFRQPE